MPPNRKRQERCDGKKEVIGESRFQWPQVILEA